MTHSFRCLKNFLLSRLTTIKNRRRPFMLCNCQRGEEQGAKQSKTDDIYGNLSACCLPACMKSSNIRFLRRWLLRKSMIFFPKRSAENLIQQHILKLACADVNQSFEIAYNYHSRHSRWKHTSKHDNLLIHNEWFAIQFHNSFTLNWFLFFALKKRHVICISSPFSSFIATTTCKKFHKWDSLKSYCEVINKLISTSS